MKRTGRPPTATGTPKLCTHLTSSKVILPIPLWEEKFNHYRRTDRNILVLAGDCRPPQAVDSDPAWAAEEVTEQLWRDRDHVAGTVAVRRPLPSDMGGIRLTAVLGGQEAVWSSGSGSGL